MRWFRDNIDGVLTNFFAARRRGCAGRRLACMGIAEQLLRDCVEAVADDVLPPAERTLLAAEQQFDGDGAAARVAQPEMLLAVLPRYVGDTRWCPGRIDERRAQVLAAGALLRHLVTVLPAGEHTAAIRTAATAVEEAAMGIRTDARLTR